MSAHARSYARRVTDEERSTPITWQGGPSRDARMLKRALALDVGDANPLEYDSARVDRAASRSGASALRTLTIPTMEDMGPPSVQVSECEIRPTTFSPTENTSTGEFGSGVEAENRQRNEELAEKFWFVRGGWNWMLWLQPGGGRRGSDGFGMAGIGKGPMAPTPTPRNAPDPLSFLSTPRSPGLRLTPRRAAASSLK